MPDIDPEARKAAQDHYGVSILCGLRAPDDPGIERLAVNITGTYAPRIAAYEKLRRAVQDQNGERDMLEALETLNALEKKRAAPPPA